MPRLEACLPLVGQSRETPPYARAALPILPCTNEEAQAARSLAFQEDDSLRVRRRGGATGGAKRKRATPSLYGRLRGGASRAAKKRLLAHVDILTLRGLFITGPQDGTLDGYLTSV